MRHVAIASIMLACGACGRGEDPAVSAGQAPAARTPLDELAEQAGLGAEYAASSYAKLKAETPDFAKRAAARIAPGIVTTWDALANHLRKEATVAGVERARGKTHETLYAAVPAMLDDLAPHAPELAQRWSALEPELAELERAAHDAEANDKRPKVILWSEFHDRPTDEDMVAVELFDCVEAALAARWPTVKFVPEYRRPDGANIEMKVASASDTYRSSTGQEIRMAAGAGLRLVPDALPKVMAKGFSKPIEAIGESKNPGRVSSDLGVTPTMETSRAGLKAIQTIRDEVCADVVRQLGTP